MRKLLSSVELTTILVSGVFALQPNYVKTITYDVDGNGSNIESIEYTDGFGRNLQNKLRLPPDSISPGMKDRVSCTFYDKSGRPQYSTKPFVDDKRGGEFLPGEIVDNNSIDNDLEQLLYNQYTDRNAFSRTSYWDNPMGQVRTSSGPGDSLIYGMVKNWKLGVCLRDTSSITVTYTGVNLGTVDFENGMIIRLTTSSASILLSDLLDGLHYQFLLNNPFLVSGLSEPQYILSISMASDNKIFQELKDLFGKTIRTLSGPDTNSITGSKVIANYSYDINGNLLEEIPPASVSSDDHTFYSYNTAGQIIYNKTPDGGEYDYKYRIDGQLDYVLSYTGSISQWDRKNIYNYDELGRLIKVSVEKPVADSSSIERHDVGYYFYDDIDQLRTKTVFSLFTDFHYNQLSNLYGRLAGRIAVNFPGTDRQVDIGEIFSYDEEGRIIKKFRVMGGSPLIQEIVFLYDIHGNVVTESFYYSGDRIRKRYEYDELGRLSRIYNGKLQSVGSYLETELMSYDYNQLGHMKTKTFSAMAGVSPYQLNFEHDIRDRLKRLQSPLGRYGYNETINYAKSGNIYALQNNYVYNQSGITITQPYNMSYIYDDLNRLKTVTCSDTNFNSQYLYDIKGRFDSKKEGSSDITGYNYYPNTNRLERTSKNPGGLNSYIFSKHGNLLVDFTKNMIIEYDWRDMPCIFRFYDNLSSAGITKDAKGTYSGTDLYSYMESVTGVKLLSMVMTLYDTGGNRVAKMNVRE